VIPIRCSDEIPHDWHKKIPHFAMQLCSYASAGTEWHVYRDKGILLEILI